jgi:hypothetical protein
MDVCEIKYCRHAQIPLEVIAPVGEKTVVSGWSSAPCAVQCYVDSHSMALPFVVFEALICLTLCSLMYELC